MSLNRSRRPIMVTTLLLCLSLFNPTCCLVRNQCGPSLGAPFHRFEIIRASKQLESIRGDPKFNLLYQMLQHPCLEVEYLGGNLLAATIYRLYGTCNYRRMYRFTVRQTYYQCWHVELTLWNRTVPGTAGFERYRPLTERYELQFLHANAPIFVKEIIGNYSRAATFAPREWEFYGGAAGPKINGHIRPPGGPYATIPKCRCSNRFQIAMWSKAESGDAPNMTLLFVQYLCVLAVLVALGYAAFRTWISRIVSWGVCSKCR